MKIKDMEIFLDLLNTQSPTLTASNFSTSQPNVSIIIKNLEETLSTILFERLGKKLLPTSKALLIGKIWLKLVEDYYKSLEIINDDTTLLGEINIASTQSISEYFVNEILFKFKDHFPKVNAHHQTQNTQKSLHLLKNGLIEMAIIETNITQSYIDHESFIKKEWYEDELIVVSANEELKNKEFYIDELLDKKWIFREKGSGLRDAFLKKIGKVSKNFPIFLELDRANAIKELILKQDAISFFSKKAVERELQNNILYPIKIKNINLKRKFYVVKRKDYSFNRALDKFEDFLFEYKNL
ncbi:LysR family transcriptional regulator [Campylobacter sp. 2018MI35]|uniref:LysR family transcriptional regulator n=2 Tax=unclassified Campylobacter TaxID=2593542 RepID=UPI001904C9EF|nr:LysR family transcriptional regulator [Campylobacter sp. 2018MI34]MBK1992151.1 LysR family transcriptional regulator [Campylobacter sp. 2018MI34]